MMEKIKMLLVVLIGVLMLSLADGVTVEAAGTDLYDTWYEYYENALAYYETRGKTIGDYHLVYADDTNTRFYFYSSTSPFTIGSNNTVDYKKGQTIHYTVFYAPACTSVDFEADVYSGAWCENALSTSVLSSYTVANFDVCATGSSDIALPVNTIFFLGPLSPLGKVAAAIQPKTVLIEIITMLPLLIPLLAGYLGLRKALSLVSKTLKMA